MVVFGRKEIGVVLFKGGMQEWDLCYVLDVECWGLVSQGVGKFLGLYDSVKEIKFFHREFLRLVGEIDFNSEWEDHKFRGTLNKE